ncbi:MAG: hypothetical protein ACI9ZV_000738 [Candidatus Azotimanducaceae bacterium]|jgi:hypothetical protein
MRTTTLLPSRVIKALLLAGVTLSSYNASHAELTETDDLYRIIESTPQTLEKTPINLARWHMGATLVLVKDDQFQRIEVPDVGYFDEAVFLSDNSSLTYNIEKGQHDYIIDLGQSMSVSRFFLNNQSAVGTFELSTSDTLEDLDSRFWVELSNPVVFEKGVIPSVSFPEVKTRYILVRFKIDSAGTIGNFGATGPPIIAQVEFNIDQGETEIEEEEEIIQAQTPIDQPRLRARRIPRSSHRRWNLR